MTYSLRGTSILIHSTLAIALITSGCQLKRPDRVDGQVVLNGLPSPNVKGVGDTMKQSAEESEKKGDYRHANQLYRQLVDKDPENLDYKMHYADTSRRADFFKPAIDTYNEILAKEPENVDALEGKGLAMLGKGDFDGAGDTLGQVIAKDKTRWRALNAMGILFVSKGMYQEAMAYYTEALTHSPNNVRVLNNVGLTLAVKKEIPDAIESLSMASSLVPNDQPRLKEQVDLNLALVYGIAGDIDQAENIASRHLSGAALDNNLGLYAHLANDDVMAKSYLNMALNSSSRFYNRAWQNLAAIESKGGNGEGVTTMAKSYKVAPPKPIAPVVLEDNENKDKTASSTIKEDAAPDVKVTPTPEKTASKSDAKKAHIIDKSAIPKEKKAEKKAEKPKTDTDDLTKLVPVPAETVKNLATSSTKSKDRKASSAPAKKPEDKPKESISPANTPFGIQGSEETPDSSVRMTSEIEFKP